MKRAEHSPTIVVHSFEGGIRAAPTFVFKPDTPDTSDTPDPPDTPNTPNTPDTPDTPDTSDTCHPPPASRHLPPVTCHLSEPAHRWRGGSPGGGAPLQGRLHLRRRGRAVPAAAAEGRAASEGRSASEGRGASEDRGASEGRGTSEGPAEGRGVPEGRGGEAVAAAAGERGGGPPT